ncbi:hypothetical protein PCE1_002467 [Barthelona sp. PCE]
MSVFDKDSLQLQFDDEHFVLFGLIYPIFDISYNDCANFERSSLEVIIEEFKMMFRYKEDVHTPGHLDDINHLLQNFTPQLQTDLINDFFEDVKKEGSSPPLSWNSKLFTYTVDFNHLLFFVSSYLEKLDKTTSETIKLYTFRVVVQYIKWHMRYFFELSENFIAEGCYGPVANGIMYRYGESLYDLFQWMHPDDPDEAEEDEEDRIGWFQQELLLVTAKKLFKTFDKLEIQPTVEFFKKIGLDKPVHFEMWTAYSNDRKAYNLDQFRVFKGREAEFKY